MVARAAIALGSNVGDRADHLETAVWEIEERVGPATAVSGLYETTPVGGPEQGPYLNAVVVLQTLWSAHSVLARLLDIELRHGRERRERWGPRTLDLDLLIHGTSVIDEPGLTLPHPRMTERRFVLVPLLEAWPDVELPDGTPLEWVLEDLGELSDPAEIVRIGDLVPHRPGSSDVVPGSPG